MKKIILFMFCMLCCVAVVFGADNPRNPTVPSVSGDNGSTTNIGKSNPVNIDVQRESSIYTKGTTTAMSKFFMTGLTWTGNENGMQSIQIDYVKSIRIKGYTMQKTTKDNLSVVFYFPYLYDIVLTDGQILTDVIGKIKEIDSFNITTSLGQQKCYTYFVRYWLEDKGEFVHNGSKDYNEKPEVPDEAVIKIEFKR